MRTAPALLAALLASCTVGPDYRGPAEFPLAQAFARTTGGQAVPQAPNDRWWLVLGNSQLDRLIAEALQNNLDVGIAAERIHEARALRRQTAASLAPQLQADLSFSRLDYAGLLDDDLRAPLRNLGVASPLDSWSTSLQAGWEINVFGGRRRAVEGARAREDAARAAHAGVRLAVAGEMADAYFSLAALRERKTLLSAQIDGQQQQVADIRNRQQAGAASRLDLDRAVGRLETTRSDLPGIDAALVAQTERIALLLGRHARSLETSRLDRASLPVRLPMVHTGFPAGLVHRRPDLRQIERQVAATAADVGLAVSAFYPRFSIGGGPSGAATTVGNLFDASSFYWQYGPRIDWTPFSGGANRAALDAANSRQKAALLGYEKAVLGAAAEVETRLSQLRADTSRLSVLQRAEAALADAVDQVQQRHEAGSVPLLEVLDEEQRLRNIQLAEVTAKAAMITSWIRLHQSLGGGWK